MKPDYVPHLTIEDYLLAWEYGFCRSDVYCFLRDIMQREHLTGTRQQEENCAFLLMAIYNVGRMQGIREERWNRREKERKQPQPTTEPKNRAELMQEITRRLESADYRKLRLVWVYTSHLIG